MAANGRAAGRTSAGDHTTSPLLGHSSPTIPANEAGDDSLEYCLTRSEEVSMPLFASAEMSEQMAASVRRYGSVNHQEYGMDHLALRHTEGNQSGRRSSRRSSNTLDEDSIEMSEVGKLVEVGCVGAELQRDMALWKERSSKRASWCQTPRYIARCVHCL